MQTHSLSLHAVPALTALAVFLATMGAVSPTVAQEAADGRLTIELNAMSTDEAACTIVFLLQNEGAAEIESVVYEAVLFDASGGVNRLTLFDFGTLPAARPRVRQFVIPELSCDDLGSVLINGAQTCTIGGAPSEFCEDSLGLRSRVDVKLIG
ncbi:MAG: hypothetical protein AAFR47_13120 [Pseudomonadota bacterium]